MPAALPVARLLLTACLLAVAGCAVLPPTRDGAATLVVTPQIAGGDRTVQAVMAPYTKASISHLAIALNSLATGSPVQVQSADLSNAQVLTGQVTFSNLRGNTAYQVVATAYMSADTSLPISVAASSTVSLTTTNDNAPTLASVPVTLANQTFAGQASTGITFTNGQLIGGGSESSDSTLGVTTLSIPSTTFSAPTGVAYDGANHLFVADVYHHAVKQIDLTTKASTTLISSLNSANGVCSDGAGNLYIADYQAMSLIRLSLATGAPTTLLSSGIGNPNGVVYDGAGSLYLADGTGGRVLKISNLASTPPTVTPIASGLSTPYNLALDSASQTLYVANFNGHTIAAIALAATPPTTSVFAGSGAATSADGNGLSASFINPCGLALDGLGNLYVSDYGSNVIRRIRLATRDVTTVIGTAAGLHGATGLVFDRNGTLYEADQSTNLIKSIQ